MATAKDQSSRAVYVISVAAELAGVHAQTLRIYERKGLVDPAHRLVDGSLGSVGGAVLRARGGRIGHILGRGTQGDTLGLHAPGRRTKNRKNARA